MSPDGCDKHGPNRLSRHRRIHQTVMGRYRDEGFVREDVVDYEMDPGTGLVHLRGRILCLGGIIIDVAKAMLPIGDSVDPEVQTIHYSYAARVQGHGCFLRYDNSPHHGHQDPHHRHVGDWRDLAGAGEQIQWVGRANWPTLGDVVSEARDWYWAHYDELPET